MLNKDELFNAYSESFQLINTLDYQASNIVTLDIDSIDKFMMLAKTLQAKQVYYKYRYYMQDDFLLWIEKYDDFSENIKNKAKLHNDKVESLDFSIPAQLDLFILISGTIMKVFIFDFWMDDLKVLDRETKEAELEERFSKEFKEIEEREEKKKKEDEVKLSEYILSDPEFSYMKNMRLRQDYLLDLFSKDDFKRYSYLFDGVYDRGISIPAKNFMDRLWAEHKAIKKKD